MVDFKVGDRVRRVSESPWPDDFGRVGEEYTVLETSINAGTIKVIDGRSFASAHAFELIEQPWDYDPRTAKNDNALKIEAGNFYKTRDGRKVGPVTTEDTYMSDPYPFRVGDWYVKANGIVNWGGGFKDEDDLISEWVDEPSGAATLTVSITADCSALNSELDAILAKLKRIKKQSRKLGIDISSGDLRAA